MVLALKNGKKVVLGATVGMRVEELVREIEARSQRISADPVRRGSLSNSARLCFVDVGPNLAGIDFRDRSPAPTVEEVHLVPVIRLVVVTPASLAKGTPNLSVGVAGIVICNLERSVGAWLSKSVSVVSVRVVHASGDLDRRRLSEVG